MKQNSIKKCILTIILMFIGLFMINTEVYAEDYIDLMCKYEVTYIQNDYSGNHTHNISFNLVYKNNKWSVSGGVWDGGSVGRDVVGLDSNTKYHNFGNGKSCPNVIVYKRKTVTNKFYITSENLKTNCEQLGKEKIDGYTCKNIYGVYSGVDITDTLNQSCKTDVKNSIKSKLDNEYKTITSLYSNYHNQLLHSNLDVSSLTTKDEVDRACKKLQNDGNTYADKLHDKFKNLNFQGIVDSALKDAKCTLTDDLFASYNSKLKTQESNLVTAGRDAYNKCVNSAIITDDEKDDLKDDNNDDADEKIEDIGDRVDYQFDSWIEKIPGIDLGGNVRLNCEGLLGDDLLDLINDIFNYVKIAAPILLIVLGIVDFGQAVLSDDRDALKKATSKFVKRAIVCVVIFFVPLILNYVLGLIDKIGTDPLCGIK